MKKILYIVLFLMVCQVRATQVPAIEYCGGKCPDGQHCVFDENSNSIIPTYKCVPK